jgi:hypothetical protein
MPSAIRCNLPGHPYECSTCTVSEQFLLNPFAAPGRFAPDGDHDKLGDRKRLRRDAQIAVRNASKLKKLIAQLKTWRNGQAPEPVVIADTLPETINNIIGTWLAKAIEHTRSHYYGFAILSDHPHHLVGHPDGKLDAFFQYFNAQVPHGHIVCSATMNSFTPIFSSCSRSTARFRRNGYHLPNTSIIAPRLFTTASGPAVSIASKRLQSQDQGVYTIKARQPAAVAQRTSLTVSPT